VSLEPCSHAKGSGGKSTPPCASTLVASGVARVVVGCVDPNPKVAGNGVATLEAAGVVVELMDGQEGRRAKRLIADFADRITSGGEPNARTLTGASKASLRRVGNNLKRLKSLREIRLPSPSSSSSSSKGEVKQGGDGEENQTLGGDGDVAVAVAVAVGGGAGGKELARGEDEEYASKVAAALEPVWLAEVDALLRSPKKSKSSANVHANNKPSSSKQPVQGEGELVLVRMGKKCPSKKAAKAIGEAVAGKVGAQVAQALGHTVLLYRPASPPIIDLDQPSAKGGGSAAVQQQ